MKDKIVNLAKQLIEIESTKDNSNCLDAVLKFSEKILKEFTAERFAKNSTKSILFYKEKKRPAKFKVILNAHLDVVPAKKDQFKPFIKNGRLYGRGAYDMKSAAAVEILVFQELTSQLSYPLGLQLVTDEEIGGFNGTKYQVEKGVRTEFVIAGEGTDLDINNKTKGILWVKIVTKGKTAHGAYVWNGSNALLEMNKVVDNLQKIFPVPKKETWKTTANIASVETANRTFNKVPDECTLYFDVRFIPEDKDSIIKKIRSCLTKNSSMEIIVHEPAEYTAEDNEYIMTLKQAISETGSRKAKTIAKHGGSDVRHFIGVGNSGVSFGPIGAGLHTDTEFVDIESLVTYYECLKKFLLNINCW